MIAKVRHVFRDTACQCCLFMMWNAVLVRLGCVDVV